MSPKWTEAQLSAINTDGRELLVSAGAGSGKTAVLTERIIRRLTSETAPSDITKMLIVTFTKAAAGELRERISGALTKALAENPKNKHLARQLLMLERAKICTIHSFCLDVLREGANEEDFPLPIGFRIADDAEIKLLRSNIMNELIEDCYLGKETEHKIYNFADFADSFAGTKGDDSLAQIFLKIENTLSSYKEGIDFIKNFADDLSIYDDNKCKDFSLTMCGREIVEYVKNKYSSYREIISAAIPEISEDEKLNRAYFAAFSKEIDNADEVISAAEVQNYMLLREKVLGYIPEKLGSVRGYELSPAIERAKESRKDFKKEREKLISNFFTPDEIGLRNSIKNTAGALYNLYALLFEFQKEFSDEKKKRLIADYNDLERLTYNRLVFDGKPTDKADSIRERYDEIYIDEYQDVNALQDGIFSAISRGNNRFMVGDIKQSIYSFRGAEPCIFADYRRKFGRVGDGQSKGAAVFLSDNFRCDKNVIDFTNIVSSCLFTSGRGDIPFTEDDMLKHSKQQDEIGTPVNVVLISGEEDESDEEIDDVSLREAKYITCEIEKLLANGVKNDGSRIMPSDVAILMRSTKASSPIIEEELRKRGIPCHNNTSGDFFENAEVLLALCILNIIDNPTRDIYLAGTLKSPIFNFTLDELINIRRAKKDGSLYEALRVYSENGFTKGQVFLEKLEAWRLKAEGSSVDKLLWYIYTDTDIQALVYDKNSPTRRKNLMLLYEHARKFEASSFKGLYNFIEYINDILSQKATFENAKESSESSNAVKIMTIHQSKGLEFPVCFVAGTGKKFNDQDLRQSIVMERSLGIGLKLSDSTGFARYDTVIRQAVVKRLEDSLLEEEMRVLYVALTRARERLYVTALVKEPQKLLDKAHNQAMSLSKFAIMKNSGYMSWILTALEHNEITGRFPSPATIQVIDELTIDTISTNDYSSQFEDIQAKESSLSDFSDEELDRFVKEQFEFEYPKSYAAKLPAKLSVSKLVPNLFDEDSAYIDGAKDDTQIDFKRPLFLDKEAASSYTGTEIGTATHLFMQFCNFDYLKSCDNLEKAIEDEILRLSHKKFITERAASLINRHSVAKFFKSDTFSAIIKSKKLWREHRFNVKLPADLFTTSDLLREVLKEEKVLVQGVMDCIYENSDGTLTLVDYKTDYISSGLSFEEASELLKARHGLQLKYYKKALEKISSKKVSRVLIYSFGLGKEIIL